MTEFYSVSGTSDSGDFYHLGIYEREPTAAELSTMIRDYAPGEVDTEGVVSFLRPDVVKVEVRSIPNPDPNPLGYV